MSEIKKIEKPEFNSDIPEHLLAESSEKDKYIIHTLSMLRQEIQWSSNLLIETHHQALKTNGRVTSLEGVTSECKKNCITRNDVKKFFFGSKWGVGTILVFSLIMPVFVGAIVGLIIKYFTS